MTPETIEDDQLGPIDIRLPMHPAASRILRLAASGAASLAGYTVDEIDDVKIAVSEILLALIDHAGGSVIDVTFEARRDSFTVSGRTSAGTLDPLDPDLVLCRRVLEGVGARFDIERIDDDALIWAAIPHVPIE